MIHRTPGLALLRSAAARAWAVARQLRRFVLFTAPAPALARALSVRRFVLFSALVLAVAPAPALARSIAIRGFDVEVIVRRDGTIRVTEHITVHFEGEWNGLYRTIPVAYDWNGFNYSLRLDFDGAVDQRGNRLEVDSEREGGRRKFRIWVPGARDATHTITLAYTVKNGLRFFEDHDELYWNVTGTEWDVPVGTVRATVILPPEVTNVRAAAYTGMQGSTQQDATWEQTANSVTFRTGSPLEFREGLTVVVGWDPGIVHRPTQAERAAAFAAANGILLVPLVAFFLMHGWWRKHGRDPEALSIVPQYEPPDELTPGEVGMLVDNRADLRDVTATLVDLAVRGFIVIEEKEESKLFGLLKNDEFVFRSVREPSTWAGLLPHEYALLSALFDGGTSDSIELSDLENSFYKDLPGIRDHLSDSLVERGFCTRRPDKVVGPYIALGLLAGVGVGFAGSAFLASRGESPLPAIVAGGLTAVVMVGFGLIMPARTVRGARTREHALGFEEFLRRVDKDRFERVIKTPEMFERFLPFAMAFGVEKNWARAFDDIYREPPQWYHGRPGTRFVAYDFTSNLSRMAGRTGTAMASSPRSSSGGSGFSGGSSGGGFGGGGGGGF